MEDQPHIIETATPPEKNRFPIAVQLGILGAVLLVLFGTLLFPNSPTPPPVSTPATEITNQKTPAVPQKLSEDIAVRAEAAYVWDVHAQRALYSKNATAALPLASITKLMTTLLAYELVSDTTNTTVPLSAILQEGSSGLAVGEAFTTETLRELALISSSNDAAFALAAAVGAQLGDQDPTTQFIAGMNIRAEELGLETLEFKNTTGLDLSLTEPGAIGSAKDVSFLMEYIITHYPEIVAPTTQVDTRVYNTAGAYHEVENTNEIAAQIPSLIGSKTGYTDLAGGNLTIAFDAGLNRPIIITVLGSTRDERFNDVLTLMHGVQDSLGTQ